MQYCSDLPATLDPFVTIGGEPEAAPLVELALGAPGRSNSSVGAAAGENLEDAVSRAALETLEHLHLDRMRSGADVFAAVDPAAEPSIAAHLTWLSGQFRCIDIRVSSFSPGYCTAVAACCDLDGGRRTEGSAARTDRQEALRAATEEAIFHWRNMVELERAAPDLGAMADEDRERVARYRGALPRESWPAPGAEVGGNRGEADMEGLLAAVAVVSGRRVRVFDFTVEEVGMPVVKIHLG